LSVWADLLTIAISRGLIRPGRPPTSLYAIIAGIVPVRAIDRPPILLEHNMSKRARKRRSRKGNAANHGRKPNA
jgi:hypothetical protein